MAIKWIVTDMDGTLLNSQDQITEETKECLMACQRKGIRLILASGRSYVRLQRYVDELEMRRYDGCLIEVNGTAFQKLGTGERKIFGQLRKDDIGKICSALEREQTEIQGMQDEGFYFWIPDWMRPLKEQERIRRGYPEDFVMAAGAWSWLGLAANNYPMRREIHSLDEMPEQLNKINALSDPEHMEKVYRKLMECFGGQYEIVRTCPRLVELTPLGINKGRVLKQVMENEGIAPDEVMVFGDGENDADMFHQVTYGIAMGNAADYVKEHAFDVTEDNNHDGLAAALKKYGVL